MLALLAPVVAVGTVTALPGVESFVVLSGSMEPALSPGDLVIVRPGSYGPGDVVSFERGSAVVTHRLVEQTADGWITRGDANDADDPRPVPTDRIVGEVVLSIPLYGRLVRFVGTPVGYVVTVLVPGLVLLGWSGREIVENLR